MLFDRYYLMPNPQLYQSLSISLLLPDSISSIYQTKNIDEYLIVHCLGFFMGRRGPISIYNRRTSPNLWSPVEASDPNQSTTLLDCVKQCFQGRSEATDTVAQARPTCRTVACLPRVELQSPAKPSTSLTCRRSFEHRFTKTSYSSPSQ